MFLLVIILSSSAPTLSRVIIVSRARCTSGSCIQRAVSGVMENPSLLATLIKRRTLRGSSISVFFWVEGRPHDFRIQILETPGSKVNHLLPFQMKEECVDCRVTTRCILGRRAEFMSGFRLFPSYTSFRRLTRSTSRPHSMHSAVSSFLDILGFFFAMCALEK